MWPWALWLAFFRPCRLNLELLSLAQLYLYNNRPVWNPPNCRRFLSPPVNLHLPLTCEQTCTCFTRSCKLSPCLMKPVGLHHLQKSRGGIFQGDEPSNTWLYQEILVINILTMVEFNPNWEGALMRIWVCHAGRKGR